MQFSARKSKHNPQYCLCTKYFNYKLKKQILSSEHLLNVIVSVMHNSTFISTSIKTRTVCILELPRVYLAEKQHHYMALHFMVLGNNQTHLWPRICKNEALTKSFKRLPHVLFHTEEKLFWSHHIHHKYIYVQNKVI